MAKKRAPTEMEVRQLLRDAARRMEDETEIGDCAMSLGGARALTRLVPVALGGIALLVLLYYQPSMRSLPGMLASMAWLLSLVQGVELGRLTRVAKALARTVERAKLDDPLPRAPSPRS